MWGRRESGETGQETLNLDSASIKVWYLWYPEFPKISFELTIFVGVEPKVPRFVCVVGVDNGATNQAEVMPFARGNE